MYKHSTSEKTVENAYGHIVSPIYTDIVSRSQKHKLDLSDQYSQILKGFYPALYSRNISPALYYNQYIATYVERDARLIKNIQNLSQFQKFIGLLAGRVGQIVNMSSLANDTGISPNTAEDWASILEASYIVYRLRPYYKNVGKRLIKSEAMADDSDVTSDLAKATNEALGNSGGSARLARLKRKKE